MKLIITCNQEKGFWRGGMHFPKGETILDTKGMDKDKLKAIKDEPRLHHREATKEDEKEAGGNPGDPSARYHRFRAKATGDSIEVAGQKIYKSKWQVFQNADQEPMTDEALALVEQLVADGTLEVEIFEGDGYRPLNDGEGLKA